MSYLYIDNTEKLEVFCQKVGEAEYCAIDTEFVREKTYYPVLALIQLATEADMACIDPLTIEDFGPLKTLLQNPDLIKVFHSSSQDLEILYQQFDEVPNSIFDTQLAAAALGFQHQISYAGLVEQVTGVKLDKKHTRADWTRRPLSSDELDYAMDDVVYLMPVYRFLKKELDEKGRYSWIAKDMLNMSQAANYEQDVSILWKRLKGVQKLRGVQLQVASLLSQWREGLAQKKNRPRRWIFKDELIIDISRQMPSTLEDLVPIRDMSEKIIAQYGQLLLQIVIDAQATKSSEWPKHSVEAPLTGEELALGDCLMAVCRLAAEDNQVALASLATRKDVDNLIVNRKNSRLAQGWRFTMVGEQLLNFIHGQSTLRVVDKRMELSLLSSE